MKTNKLFIFLIFSPTIEILVSRIIDYLVDNKISRKDEFLILYPQTYKLQLINDIEAICFDNYYLSNDKNYAFKNKIFKKKYSFFERIKYLLYSFRRFSNVFGRRLTLRLNKLPVSLFKIQSYFHFVNRLKLKNKKVILFTPNIKVHIFQILVFYTRNFQYQLLEEGIAAFKSIEETENHFKLNFKIILADIFGLCLRFTIIILRMVIDVIRNYLKFKEFSLRNLSLYINTPIFSGGLYYLGKHRPIFNHKISDEAFQSMSEINCRKYEIRSRYEKNKINEIAAILENLKNKKFDLFILPGDNLNILKNEFDKKLINKTNVNTILLRPHPRLSHLTIKQIVRLLSLEVSEESILLSESFRNVPVEILSYFENFNFIFSGLQRSSLIHYFKNKILIL